MWPLADKSEKDIKIQFLYSIIRLMTSLLYGVLNNRSIFEDLKKLCLSSDVNMGDLCRPKSFQSWLYVFNKEDIERVPSDEEDFSKVCSVGVSGCSR